MSGAPHDLREAVAAAARMLAAAGLVEAFGHASARTEGGFLITGTGPMFEAGPDDVILVEQGAPTAGPVEMLPLETPMHQAVYEARPDVRAICRGHPPYAVVWGVGTEPLPLLHGLGGMAGRTVRVYPDIGLVKSAEEGRAVAAVLGRDSAVLLRANGCLAVGEDLAEAAARLWYLEERARVAVQARGGAIGARGAPPQDWAARLGDSSAEMVRARRWLTSAHGAVPGAGEGQS